MDDMNNENISEKGTDVTPDISEDMDEALLSELSGEAAACDEAECSDGGEDYAPAHKTAAGIFDIFEMFAICTAVILLLFTYVTRLTVVDGESMMDTLQNSDYLIVQELGYTPTRGDIVVLQKIDAGYYQKPLIKRVIAVGGDTVDIDFDTWTVYVNGEALDEPYCNLEGPTLTSTTKLPLTVEEGKIFVMGDHRNHSADSRRTEIGQVDERCVVGRAVLRVLPLDKISILRRAQYN